MKIAIVGAGNVGRALAAALRGARHDIVFGVRHPGTAPDEASVLAATVAADAIILAVPFDAVGDIAAAAGPLDGKIVIDATNPLGIGGNGLGLTVGFQTSGAERIAALMPQAAIFKTFNQTGFENLGGASSYAERPVMFVAGDDEAKKPVVMRLVADAGFEAVDCGGLLAARLLEPFGMVWIELARKRGHGPDFAFTMQRRTAR